VVPYCHLSSYTLKKYLLANEIWNIVRDIASEDFRKKGSGDN
jgi:hypothetical protein